MILECRRLKEGNDGICGCCPPLGSVCCKADIVVPHIDELLSRIEDYSAMQFERQSTFPQKNIRERREDNLAAVRQQLKSKRAVLAVGAGVSVPMGMPTWAGLLSKLVGYAFQYHDWAKLSPSSDLLCSQEKQQKRFQMLQLEQKMIEGELQLLNETNVLEAAQYVKEILNLSGTDGTVLIKSIISSIIEKSTRPDEFLSKYRTKHGIGENKKIPRRDIAKDNSLCAVAYLLQAKGGFRKAMTYNYDTLIQEFLLSSIFRVNKDRLVTHSEGWTFKDGVKNPIEIFHLHGCIPRKENQGKLPSFPPESQQIILSEDSYYDTERLSAYNWQNSVQSYFLNRNTCVFVGFSADDYNFRRILRQQGELSDSNCPIHYLIFPIDELIKNTWRSVCQSHLSEKGERTTKEVLQMETLALVAREMEMKEQYWKRYHFCTIWATIDDIPSVLLSLLDK